jgi:phosphoribosylanthranilate isomerase
MNPRTRVKICGLTTPADALAAVAAGADALGFMFYRPSTRYVTLEAAAEIIRALPPFVARVGVFVDAPAGEVRATIAAAGLNALQFHGAETPDFCRSFGLPTCRAFRIKDADSVAACAPYEGMAWLLDSYVPGQVGGTGAVFNWALAAAARARNPWIILAGGLTPGNVREAIAQAQPWAVDVSSGVESAPGRKDPDRMRAFVQAARG